MTPHEALNKIYNGNELLREAYKIVLSSLNRLQELEIVNERLEKEIREVLKK